MMKDLIEGSGEVGLGAETCKSVVDKHLCLRGDGGHYDLHPNGTAANFSRKVPRFWVTLSISSRNRRKTACKKEYKMQTRSTGRM